MQDIPTTNVEQSQIKPTGDNALRDAARDVLNTLKPGDFQSLSQRDGSTSNLDNVLPSVDLLDPGNFSDTGKKPVKPGDKPPVDSGDKPPVKPGDKPPVKPGDKPPVKPGDKPPIKPGDKPPVDLGDKPPVKPGDKPPVDLGDKPPVKPGDKPPVKPESQEPLNSNGIASDDSSRSPQENDAAENNQFFEPFAGPR